MTEKANTNHTPQRNKEAEYYDRAARLYIEERKSIPEIAKIIDVSEVSLRNWRNKGDWDRKRRERQASEKTNDDVLLEIATRRIEFLKNKAIDAPATWQPSDSDELAKMNRITLRNKDQKTNMQHTIRTVMELASFISAQAPELAASVAEYFDGFLTQKQEEAANV